MTSMSVLAAFGLLLAGLAQSGAEDPVADEVVVTLPPSRGGQDLVDQAFEGLHPDRWLRAPDGFVERATTGDRGQVTLYRWWTDGCGFCKASLPAIESLRKKYEDKGLDVVAVYHPKPARGVDDRTVVDGATALGYRGVLAIDADWSELERLYLDRAERKVTSITIIVDGTGTIRFVHPGPMFFPASQGGQARANADHEMIEDAIRALLPDRSP